jgi:hypothetical protein
MIKIGLFSARLRYPPWRAQSPPASLSLAGRKTSSIFIFIMSIA